MKQSRVSMLLALAFTSALVASDDKKKDERVKSDLIPGHKRRATVELAQQLTRPPVPESLPAELAQPFNPPGFDLPDRNEAPPVPQPSAGGGGVGAGGGAIAGAGGVGGGGPAPAAPVPGEREKLDSLAAKITPTGTILTPRGERVLIFTGAKQVRIGSDFTVSTNGQKYVLKLVAADATTFTLRLGSEEVTRSIKPGK